MLDPTRLFTVTGVSLCLSLGACNTDSNDPATPAAGTDHGAANDSDYATTGPLPDSNSQTDPHAGERHALGSITLAGGTFTVAMTGDIAPSTELHFDITQTAGPTVETLRLWIGDQSAKGSLKSKATAHNNYFHAHVESPVTLAMDSAFWMEAKNASGEREQASVALN